MSNRTWGRQPSDEVAHTDTLVMPLDRLDRALLPHPTQSSQLAPHPNHSH
jgi:hypothetical protein